MQFTTTKGIKISIDGVELSLYTFASDLDLANNLMTISARDDTNNKIAKIFQDVNAGTMFEIKVMPPFRGGVAIRSHEITNIDVVSLRYVTEVEHSYNLWQLSFTFAECVTTYPE